MQSRVVAYYRVSTDRQGRSGLGLEAQRSAVQSFCKDASIVAEFTEVESGRKPKRPQLAAAIEFASTIRATLVVAKLDRLARNLAFVSRLIESKIDFVACDNPNANKLTIQILAAVAEHEAEMISARTKAALAAAKAKGVKLGAASKKYRRTRPTETQRVYAAKARAVRKQQHESWRATILPIAERFHSEGLSLANIASQLNAAGYQTFRKREWNERSVFGLLSGQWLVAVLPSHYKCPYCHSAMLLRDGLGQIIHRCKSCPTERNADGTIRCEPVGKNCPRCDKQLTLKFGRKGMFIGCSGWPHCKYSEDVVFTDERG